jgi:hypothetical protein
LFLSDLRLGKQKLMNTMTSSGPPGSPAPLIAFCRHRRRGREVSIRMHTSARARLDHVFDVIRFAAGSRNPLIPRRSLTTKLGLLSVSEFAG